MEAHQPRLDAPEVCDNCVTASSYTRSKNYSIEVTCGSPVPPPALSRPHQTSPALSSPTTALLFIVRHSFDFPSEPARTFYTESLGIRRELEDKRGIAMMLVNLGELVRAGGDYYAAHSLYEEGLALARELGDRWGVGMVLHNLGH